eukprot:m51a1_g9750 hypothetical protein (1034) ;mRNA; r:1586541-1596118
MRLIGVCDGGESYDATSSAYSWGSVRIYNTNADSRALCSVTSPNDMTEATWAMLFTPPEVPYKFDSVCMSLYGTSTVANLSALTAAQKAAAVFEVQGEVALWTVVADRQSNKLRPNQKRASYPFKAAWPMAETAQEYWVTVNFTKSSLPMIAWEKGVYVGVNYWSCRKVSMSTMKDPSRPIRLVWNADNYVWKQVYGVASSSGVTRAIVLRAKGHKYDWKYGDGVCNCKCGAWDIDCLHNQSSPDCTDPNTICDQSGLAENYWAYDGCQCECGGISDPDCWDLYQNVSVCSSSFKSPVCKMNASSTVKPAYCAVPAGWDTVKCPVTDYDTGGTCTCNCGAYDPDCDTTNKVGNCQGTQTCSYQGLCIESGVLLLLLASAAAQEACEGGESYDEMSAQSKWGSIVIYHTNADSRSRCSVESPREMTDAMWAMLFTPPEVPYKYDSVCMRLFDTPRGLNSTASPTAPHGSPRPPVVVLGEVVIWTVAADRRGSKLRPDKERASYPFRASWPASDSQQPHWVTVHFSEPHHSMIAWERGVYIGVRYSSCGDVAMSTMKDTSRPIRLVWNADNHLWKQVYGDTSDSGKTRAIGLRAKGHKHDWRVEGIPPSWKLCPKSKYGDGVCNCECGAWDIDCLHNQSSPDCKNTEICDQSGHSTGCRAGNYWAYDGCQCECGGISDPDCWDLYQNVSAELLRPRALGGPEARQPLDVGPAALLCPPPARLTPLLHTPALAVLLCEHRRCCTVLVYAAPAAGAPLVLSSCFSVGPCEGPVSAAATPSWVAVAWGRELRCARTEGWAPAGARPQWSARAPYDCDCVRALTATQFALPASLFRSVALVDLEAPGAPLLRTRPIPSSSWEYVVGCHCLMLTVQFGANTCTTISALDLREQREYVWKDSEPVYENEPGTYFTANCHVTALSQTLFAVTDESGGRKLRPQLWAIARDGRPCWVAMLDRGPFARVIEQHAAPGERLPPAADALMAHSASAGLLYCVEGAEGADAGPALCAYAIVSGTRVCRMPLRCNEARVLACQGEAGV